MDLASAIDQAQQRCAFCNDPRVGVVELHGCPFSVCVNHWNAGLEFWRQVDENIHLRMTADKKEREREAQYEVATGRRWLV